MLRTAAAHEFHVQAVSNDESLVPSYAMVKSSRFDVISGFSPVTAFPADIMHDCLEVSKIVAPLVKDLWLNHLMC